MRSRRHAKICEVAVIQRTYVAEQRQSALFGRLYGQRVGGGEVRDGRAPLLLGVLASFPGSLFLLLRMTVVRLGQMNLLK
jgi:hypothetical protein